MSTLPLSVFSCSSILLALTVNMQNRLTNSQRYLVNAKPGTNHSTNPTNPNGNSNSNPNPTNSAYPTNPTTKYHSEFVNLFCIYACIDITINIS